MTAPAKEEKITMAPAAAEVMIIREEEEAIMMVLDVDNRDVNTKVDVEAEIMMVGKEAAAAASMEEDSTEEVR